MIQTINIPIEVIKAFKNDKNALEMLACAVIIKVNYQNSCMYGLKITHIMQVFNVSHKKAHKIRESLKQSGLFIYNEKKDCIFAKSFKSKDFKSYGKGGRLKAISDYCRKLQISVKNENRKINTSLKELVRQLRETLLLCVIHASEQDNFIVSGLKKGYVTKPNAKRAIPQRKMANAFGLSRSSANKYINRLIERNDIKRGDMVCDCVVHCLNDDTMYEYFDKHQKEGLVAWFDEKSGSWSAWRMFGYEYNTANRQISDSFKNVIYNYKYPNVLQAQTSCELDGYWKRVY